MHAVLPDLRLGDLLEDELRTVGARTRHTRAVGRARAAVGFVAERGAVERAQPLTIGAVDVDLHGGHRRANESRR